MTIKLKIHNIKRWCIANDTTCAVSIMLVTGVTIMLVAPVIVHYAGVLR
jgi:hypothetical protein